jgi:hypothetical protein
LATGISLVVVIWLLELFSHFISCCGSKMRHLLDLVVSNYDFFYMSRFPIVTFLYVAVFNCDFLIYSGFEMQNLFDVAFSIATSLYIAFWNATIPNHVILLNIFAVMLFYQIS